MDDGLSAMRRKAGAGRPPPEIGAPTAIRILRGVLMQAGEDVAALTIVPETPEETRITLDPMVEAVEDHALMALVEGTGGHFGLATLDPQLVAALIEVQTTGRVVPRPAEPRAPTRTDAIMCADFIDRVLELLETRVGEAGLPVAPALTGFRYALALAEKRAVSMTLDDVPYRRFSVGLDLGSGAKQGRFNLVLPQDVSRGGHVASGDNAAFTEALGALVEGAEARLSATLARVELPIAEVAALVPGALVPLPRGALGRVSIEDLDGRPVAQGRLGQADGHRAVRLGGAPAEEPPTGFVGATPALAPAAAAPDPLAALGELSSEPELAEPALDIGELGDLGALGEPVEPEDLPDLPKLGDLGALGDLDVGEGD